MGNKAVVLWRNTPALCAFVLLTCQAVLPWTLPRFVTADGPSHLYGATVARELVFHHKHSLYSAIYTIQRTLLPNWTTTVALAVTETLAGVAHAEKLLASIAILLGFFGLRYLADSLAPGRATWTPLMNFAIQSWFLWVGFYNFYLGMVLLPFVLGYYIRGLGRLSISRSLVIAAGIVILFFTHLIAAGLGIAAVMMIALWDAVTRRQLRETGVAIASVLPAAMLILLYIHGAPAATKTFEFAKEWRSFPHEIFTTGQGPIGRQTFLRNFSMLYVAAAALLMTFKEWRSPRTALLVATLIAFGGYLLVPDSGFGGSVVKVRFAWAVFMLGVPFAASVSRLRWLDVPVALFVSWFLIQNLIATRTESLRLNDAVAPYLATTSQIPTNASLLRLFYQAPNAPALYGYDPANRFPFIHLDSFVAAAGYNINVTDYESPTELFPLVFKKNARDFRYQLWGFEGPGPGDEKTLSWVVDNFPKPLDFILIFGDESSDIAKQQGMPRMAAWLNANMQLVSTSSDGLLRVFRRNHSGH
jgi:hypothetical protein